MYIFLTEYHFEIGVQFFFEVSKLSIFVTISKNRVDKSYLTEQKKSIDERSIKKKEEEKRATITAAYFRAYHRDFAEKKKIHFRRMRMVIRNHGDSIGSRGCKKME